MRLSQPESVMHFLLVAGTVTLLGLCSHRIIQLLEQELYSGSRTGISLTLWMPCIVVYHEVISSVLRAADHSSDHFFYLRRTPGVESDTGKGLADGTRRWIRGTYKSKIQERYRDERLSTNIIWRYILHSLFRQ